jgi:hypothetical protein
MAGSEKPKRLADSKKLAATVLMSHQITQSGYCYLRSCPPPPGLGLIGSALRGRVGLQNMHNRRGVRRPQ